MNMLLNCAECGVDWVEVPIRTVYLNDKNTYSHFHPFKDSLRIYQSILKFSGSSFISFVLDYILFNIFSLFLGILSFRNPIFFSNILARVISCGFNYHLNKKYVFHSYGNHMKALKYFTLAFGILAANTVLLQILTTIGIPAFSAKIMTEIILFIGSMLVQRFLIFMPEKNKISYQRGHIMQTITNIDLRLLNWIHEHLACSFLDFLMPKITFLGNGGLIWIAAAIIMIFFKKYRKIGIMIGTGLSAGVIIGNILLKNLIARERPCWINETVQMLISTPQDYSFPSGHTLSSFVAATIIMHSDRRMGIAAYVFASIIAFSRLYLYVHFPTDILAGALLGIIIGLIVCKFFNILSHNNLSLWEAKK